MEATAIRGMILTSSERVSSNISVSPADKLRAEQHYETNLLLREIAAQLAEANDTTGMESLFGGKLSELQETNSRLNETIAQLRSLYPSGDSHVLDTEKFTRLSISEKLQEQLEPLPTGFSEAPTQAELPKEDIVTGEILSAADFAKKHGEKVWNPLPPQDDSPAVAL